MTATTTLSHTSDVVTAPFSCNRAVVNRSLLCTAVPSLNQMQRPQNGPCDTGSMSASYSLHHPDAVANVVDEMVNLVCWLGLAESLPQLRLAPSLASVLRNTPSPVVWEIVRGLHSANNILLKTAGSMHSFPQPAPSPFTPFAQVIPTDNGPCEQEPQRKRPRIPTLEGFNGYCAAMSGTRTPVLTSSSADTSDSEETSCYTSPPSPNNTPAVTGPTSPSVNNQQQSCVLSPDSFPTTPAPSPVCTSPCGSPSFPSPIVPAVMPNSLSLRGEDPAMRIAEVLCSLHKHNGAPAQSPCFTGLALRHPKLTTGELLQHLDMQRAQNKFLPGDVPLRRHQEESVTQPSLPDTPLLESPPVASESEPMPNSNSNNWTICTSLPQKRKRSKLPPDATKILKAWLFSHKEKPYPTDDEKLALAERTNLSLLQLNNWFTNARRRILPKED
ncbi:homeobox protein TGIF2L [Pelomyxa schiedti]|nr:homeobox protein TGIF2L [Pelomyxa schiedti]